MWVVCLWMPTSQYEWMYVKATACHVPDDKNSYCCIIYQPGMMFINNGTSVYRSAKDNTNIMCLFFLPLFAFGALLSPFVTLFIVCDLFFCYFLLFENLQCKGDVNVGMFLTASYLWLWKRTLTTSSFWHVVCGWILLN